MGDAPFHQTRMGRQFYERQVPELLRQLARLNDNLEHLGALGLKAPPEEAPPAKEPDQTKDKHHDESQ